MMNKMAGLLGSMPTQSAAKPMAGGLLSGGMPPAAQAAPQQGGNPQAMQMAQMLAQSPTPETVGMIVKQLQGSQLPDADKWAQVLTQYANDPQTLNMISQEVLKTAGGNAQ